MKAFQFVEEFNSIHGDKVTLCVTDKVPGNERELPFYYYDIIENDADAVVGKISIRIGNNYHSYYNGNIGYEILEAYRGNKYSLEACQLVLRVAAYYEMDLIYITCNYDNYASIKIINLLGAEFIETVEIPRDYVYYHEGIKPHNIYKLTLMEEHT